MNKKIFFLSFLFFLTFTLGAQVRINEFMQSNINCIMDDLNDFPDSWIELYNTSDSDTNINGWYISEKGNYSKGWKINTEAIIPAKGYLLLYCDKVGSGLHADFRLETTKSSALYLFDNNGTRIDYVTDIPAQPNPNISRGLDKNGNWQYFIEATPGKENTTQTAQEITPEPVFKTKAGVYWSSLDIEIENNSGIQNSAVYYTIDGSEPTKESNIYTAPIHIDTTTVVKAKIIADNYLIPWSTTNTYIITDREFSLPIVSISLDDSYLWDDMIGIYTEGVNGLDYPALANYRQNWRRPMVVEYFPNQDSESVLNQLGELRIMGAGSRIHPLKSMAIYSHKRFGKKHFDYPIFQNQDKQDVIIKSFLLRNSGSDFPTTYFNDAFIHSLVAGKIDLEYQAYQPAIIFVNGHYWGILNIRERSNDDHVYGNYDGLEDIDLIENWSSLKNGDWNDFNYLMNGLLEDKFSYEEIDNIVDVHEFMNLFILECYAINIDFPGNNFIMWKKKDTNSKWRFILKDVDMGFLIKEFNSFDYYLTITDDKPFVTKESTALFRKLMSEKEFQKDFLNHFTVYMGDFLSPEETISVLDSLKTKLDIEMSYHLHRYKTQTIEEWNYYIRVWKKEEVLRNRPYYQYQDLNDYFGFNGLVKLTIPRPNDKLDKSVIRMNDIDLLTNQFDGMYYKGQSFKLDWIGEEKNFEGWEVNIIYEDKDPVIFTETNPNIEILVEENVESINILPLTELYSIPSVSKDKIYFYKVSNGIRIGGLDEEADIYLYDMTGKLIHIEKGYTKDVNLALPQFGIYIVRIISNNFNVSKKVIY